MNNNTNTKILYYTVQQASSILNVHENTIYRWIKDGTLNAERFGDLWRIPISEIERISKDNF